MMTRIMLLLLTVACAGCTLAPTAQLGAQHPNTQDANMVSGEVMTGEIQ